MQDANLLLHIKSMKINNVKSLFNIQLISDFQKSSTCEWKEVWVETATSFPLVFWRMDGNKTLFEERDENNGRFYMAVTPENGLSIRTKMNEWRNYTTDNSSLPENHILSLEKDSSGYIWIGTYSKGLVRLHESALGITSQSAPETEIFPNPAESNSKINFSNALPPCTISIINQQGQLICLKENPSIIDYFHLPNLVSGVYFIEFKNELWNTRIRLVVY
jgi:hypothetical protein